MAFSMPSTSRVLLPDPVIVIAAAAQGPLVHPSPRNRSISRHIRDLRSVAATSQGLRSALRDTELCISRMVVREQEKFETEWLGIIKVRSRFIADGGDRALIVRVRHSVTSKCWIKLIVRQASLPRC